MNLKTNQTIKEVFDVLLKIDSSKTFQRQINQARKIFGQKNGWNKLVKRLFTKINPLCREKIIENLLINWLFLAENQREKFLEKEGFKPPQVIVISPWMNCNLACQGCYAGQYPKEKELSFDLIQRIIKEGQAIGIYFYVISGGEPLIKPELLDLCQKHHDCYFLVYSNGTLINRQLAKKIAQLGNIALAISVEGFAKETDERRGQGAWDKIMQAMGILKKEGVIFGFSTTMTRKNNNFLISENFIDFFIKHGCSFGWYFQYIPIGRDPDTSLMPTPEQRNQLRKFIINKVRGKKAIFVGDFWNDGTCVGGCLAAGRLYLHINVNGDVEPCVFAHFAQDNIKKKSLKAILRSAFFRDLRKKIQSVDSPQKYSDNLLTPCMIIDNPWVLRDAVKKNKTYPTHQGAETIIKDTKTIRYLDNYSKKWHKIVDPLGK